jgi:signal transduction histidine kinase
MTGSRVSFRTRLTIRWTVAFGLLLAVVLAAVFVGWRTLAYRDLDGQVRTVAATELASATDGPAGVHLHDFPMEALGSGEFAGKFVQLYAGDGTLMAQSPALEASGFLLPAGVVAAGLRGEAPLAAVEIGGRPGRVVALRAFRDGARYVVAVGLFSDRLAAHLVRLAWLLAGTWIVAVGLTGLLGYLLASRALAPIDRIRDRAAAIARGDFGMRLDPPSTHDEIGRMTTLLNEMLERLHGALEANRRFAADASHELRSPLTAMAGEIDVTLKRERTAGEYRETLEVVRERLTEMSVLTENLMLLVRSQEQGDEGIVREVPLRPLLDASARRLAPLAHARGIAIRTEALPDLVFYGDAYLIARVVDNLLANAVQYNRDGGTVLLRGSHVAPVADAWEPGAALLTVTDTGPGIPRDQWDRVFDRFYRLDQSRSRRTGGAGLGLALCRAIVTLFRGTVRIVDSTIRGTTFELRLPGRLGSDLVYTAPLLAPEALTEREASSTEAGPSGPAPGRRRRG